MDRTKTLVGALLLALAVVAAVSVACAPAVSASGQQARAAELGDTSRSVHQRIAQLNLLERAGHGGKWLRRSVLRADWRLIHLSRTARDLNRSVLAMAAPDDATLAALHNLNSRLLDTQRDAMRLSQRALRPHGRRIVSRKIKHLTRQVFSVDAGVQTRPTLAAPNAGSFVQGVRTTITWTTPVALSAGSFRVTLKSTITGYKRELRESRIAVVPGTNSYAVPWNVTEPVGPSYRLWVSYCASTGQVISSDVSDSTLSIARVPSPDPAPTVTPAPTIVPTPTSTPTVAPTPTPTIVPTPTSTPTVARRPRPS